MKKNLLFAFMMLWGAFSFGQQNDYAYLSLMNKTQLSKLYLQEVQRVTMSLNLIAFDSTNADIPKTPYVSKKFKRVKSKVDSYNKMLMTEYYDVIPYADKKNIIDAILYLKTMD